MECLCCYNCLCCFGQAVRRRWSLHVSDIPGDADLRPGRNVYPTSRFVCKHGYHTTKHYGQQEDGQINFNLEFEREYFYRPQGGRGGIPACIAGGTHPTGMHSCVGFFRDCLHVPCLATGLGGGWYPSMPCRFPGPHPWGNFRGIWPGEGSLQAHTWGMPGWGVCSWGRVCSWRGCVETPPPPRRLLLRVVRILLECILVSDFF